MKLKFNYFKEILYLLGKDRIKIPLLIIFFIFNSLLDLAGIGLIGPYVAVIIDPSIIKDSSIVSKLIYFGIPQEQNTIIIIFGIVLYFVKRRLWRDVH